MADEHAGEAQKRLVDRRRALVPHEQSAEAVQPSEGALDDPSKAPQSAAVAGVLARESARDSAAAQFFAVRLRVVRAVGVHDRGSSPRSARLAADRRDAVNESQQLRDVVSIGLREHDRERHAAGVHDDVVLAARPSAVDGTWPGFFPPPRSLSRSRSPLPRGTGRVGRPPAAARAEAVAPAPRRRPPATPSAAATPSCPTASPRSSAASPTARPCAARRSSGRDICGRRSAAARLDPCAAAARADAARSTPKANRPRLPEVDPCV